MFAQYMRVRKMNKRVSLNSLCWQASGHHHTPMAGSCSWPAVMTVELCLPCPWVGPSAGNGTPLPPLTALPLTALPPDSAPPYSNSPDSTPPRQHSPCALP